MTKKTHGLPIVLALGVVGAATACSFVVDTRGLQGDAPDASIASGDAHTDAPSFAGEDATVEGGGDAGPDAPGTRLCADAGSTICDDFDDTTTLGTSWQTEIDNGAVTVVAEGLSAPNAVQVKVNGPNSAAHFERRIPFAKSIRCEVDMKIVDPPTGSEIDYLVFHTDAANHNLYVAHFDGVFALAEWKESGVNRTVIIPSPLVGQWMHVVLATDGKDLTLQWMGQSYTLANVVDVTGPDRQIQFGMPFVAGNAATRVLYDNVLCAVGP